MNTYITTNMFYMDFNTIKELEQERAIFIKERREEMRRNSIKIRLMRELRDTLERYHQPKKSDKKKT